jgi:hypothetical protein
VWVSAEQDGDHTAQSRNHIEVADRNRIGRNHVRREVRSRQRQLIVQGFEQPTVSKTVPTQRVPCVGQPGEAAEKPRWQVRRSFGCLSCLGHESMADHIPTVRGRALVERRAQDR